MATLLGADVYTDWRLFEVHNGHLSENLTNFDVDYFPPSATILSDSLYATNTWNSLAITTFSLTGGSEANSYLRDFYYRIHIIPNSFNLGNILSDQIYPTYVWNSYLDETKELDTITSIGIADLTLTVPISLPYTFKPLEYVELDLIVPEQGVSIIEGSYTYTFADQTIEIPVSGTRILFWPFAAQTDYSMTKEWLTDVIPSIHGEQRLSRRAIPRTTLRYKNIFRSDKEYATAKLIAETYSGRLFGVPVWSDARRVYDLAIGQKTIPIDTTKMELSLESTLVIWKSYELYEVKTISSITDDYITVVQPLTNSYDYACIIPVNIGYFTRNISLRMDNTRELSADVEQMTTDSFYEAGSISDETFLSLPVITTIPCLSGGLTETFTKEQYYADYNIGNVVKFDKEDYVRTTKTARFVANSKDEFYTLRRFFDYFKGKYNTFWYPSFFDDAVPFDLTLPISASYLKIQNSNWWKCRSFNVRIVGDTTVNLEIDSSTNNNDGTESLHLVTPATSTVNNIKRIFILTKVRLDADNIEFQHISRNNVVITVPLKEVL